MVSQETPAASTPTEDELRSAICNRYCRFVLHYFSDADEEAVSVADLAAAVASEKDADERQAVVRLHHMTLPKLHRIGVLDYNTEDMTVRYLGHPHLEDRLYLGESEPEYVVALQ